MKKNNSFIKSFRTKHFLPFYVENVNSKFFSGSTTNITKQKILKTKNQKKIAILDSDEYSKFVDFQAIVNHDNIKYLLNQIIWKIIAKTGSKNCDFFNVLEITSWNQPMFIFEKFEYEDLKIIGNSFAEKRYIYCLNVNPDCYMYDFIDQIEIAFVIDEKKRNISGGFTLNCGQFTQLDSFDKILEKIYLNSMVKSFIYKEISPISVNNILSVMDLYSENDFFKTKSNKKNKNGDKNKVVSKKSLDELKTSWKKYLKEKIYNDESNLLVSNQSYLENDYFFAFLNVILCCLALYEELKNYFSNNEPELFLPLFKKLDYVKENDNQNSEQDFYEIISLLKNRFYYFGKVKIKNIGNPEEALETLIKFDKFENESFGLISTLYEISRNSKIPFLNNYKDIFINSKDLKIIFLLAFDSDLLGINLLSSDFLNYKDFLKNIDEINFDESWDNMLEELVYKNVFEWNYNYVTFADANFSGLIIKNYDQVNNVKVKRNSIEEQQEQSKTDGIFNNYLWSFIYGRTIIWRLQNIEDDLQLAKSERPWELRKYLHELEVLRFSSTDDFYGIQQVKNIVRKIDTFYNFNKLNDFLKEKITKEDKLFGKGKERRNIAATFVSTTVFGILDYFTCVFSILTVRKSDIENVSPINIAFICVGCFFALILFAILFYKVFIPFILRKRKKNQFY